jgi:hypothetical protein
VHERESLLSRESANKKPKKAKPSGLSRFSPPLQGSPQAILEELHERESLLFFTKH